MTILQTSGQHVLHVEITRPIAPRGSFHLVFSTRQLNARDPLYKLKKFGITGDRSTLRLLATEINRALAEAS